MVIVRLFADAGTFAPLTRPKASAQRTHTHHSHAHIASQKTITGNTMNQAGVRERRRIKLEYASDDEI
jgi:hypothetical protein